jgi:hypothetical protein
MRFLKYTIFLLLMVRSGYAQNFSAELRKLNTEINAAKKAGKLKGQCG